MFLQRRNSVCHRSIFRYLRVTLDVQGQTKTSIDLLQETTIGDYWNIDGDKSLSDAWIGVPRFEVLNKDPPEGHVWVQGRLTKKQVTARPGHSWPEERSKMSKHSQRKTISTISWSQFLYKKTVTVTVDVIINLHT